MENHKNQQEDIRSVIILTRCIIYISLLVVVGVIILVASLFNNNATSDTQFLTSTPASKPMVSSLASENHNIVPKVTSRNIPANAWKAPDENTIPLGKEGDMIRYGKELIIHTSLYFGPKGSIANISNGLNCQNCHLDGGKRFLGNNYASFIATYPKLSGRAGKVEPASERFIECFERSLAGSAPDTTQKEIQSMLAYMKWIGKDVKKGQKVAGSGTEKLAFLDRAADPLKGEQVYMLKCQSCHGEHGEGQLALDKKSYQYPPVWGRNSYNDGAGMYRITNLAGFIKNNMPFGATYQNPQLTNEEAWDIAAFIEKQPRSHKDQHNDWKDLSKKPIDFPFGPYADQFSSQQHKFGPFGPIKAAQKNSNKNS